MTAPASIRRWSSLAVPPVHAAELTSTPLKAGSLEQALSAISQCDLDGAAFLLVRLGRAEGVDLQRAITAANASRIGTRVCLAVDLSTLEHVEMDSLVAERVGLVLDDVDADTPLSSLMYESLEAIRFRPEFVARAVRSLRLGCALEAMLALAENLGLCTLGPAKAANEGTLAPEPMFDFVPSPLREESNLSKHLAQLDVGAVQSMRVSR